LQNVNAIGRADMFFAGGVKSRSTRSEAVAIAIPPGDDPDRLGVRGRVQCRWRATADGTLRMEWQTTA
jgi:hypothetical protein